MQKSKTAQKGAGKQRPGTEQVQSSSQLQRGEGEQIQQPKVGQQLKHQQQGKTGKK